MSEKTIFELRFELRGIKHVYVWKEGIVNRKTLDQECLPEFEEILGFCLAESVWGAGQ